MNLNMTEEQKTLHYIAENMKMQKSISAAGYGHFQKAIGLLGLFPGTEGLKLWFIEGVDDLEGSIFAICSTEEKAKKAKELLVDCGFDEEQLNIYQSVLAVDTIESDSVITIL